MGQLRETRTYKWEGKGEVGGKKVEKITFTSAVDFKPGKPDKTLPYHVLSGEIKVEESKGTAHFDAAAGRLVEVESSMKLRGRMVLSSSGNNIDAEIQQKQKTTVTVLTEKPAEN
jgi:hypothetical protein